MHLGYIAKVHSEYCTPPWVIQRSPNDFISLSEELPLMQRYFQLFSPFAWDLKPENVEKTCRARVTWMFRYLSIFHHLLWILNEIFFRKTASNLLSTCDLDVEQIWRKERQCSASVMEAIKMNGLWRSQGGTWDNMTIWTYRSLGALRSGPRLLGCSHSGWLLALLDNFLHSAMMG